MPHPLRTRTFGVLYACEREFVPSVYFLPITWNGIPTPVVATPSMRKHVIAKRVIVKPDSSYPPSYPLTSSHLSLAADSKTSPKNPVMCIVLQLENIASHLVSSALSTLNLYLYSLSAKFLN